MTKHHLKMIAAVPEAERESLQKRIQWALDNGWKSLGLWGGYDDAHRPIPLDQTDLVGVPPDSKFVKFVPMAV